MKYRVVSIILSVCLIVSLFAVPSVGAKAPEITVDITSLTSTATEGTALLKWKTTEENAAFFQVLREKNGVWKSIGFTRNTGCYITGLVDKETYTFKVKAYSNEGAEVGTWREEGEKANYHYSCPEIREIKNNWHGQEVYSEIKPSGTSITVYRIEDNKVAASYPIYWGESGKTYTYVQRLYDSRGGITSYSWISHAKSLMFLKSIEDLSAVRNGDEVTLSWSAVTAAEKYKVYRYNNINGTMTFIGETEGTTYTLPCKDH